MNLTRKNFIQTVALTAGVYTIFPFKLLRAEENKDLLQLIQTIGNTNGEKERALLLEKILQDSDLVSTQKEMFEKLFFISDHWANGFEKYANPGSEGNEGSGFLCGFLSVCKIDRFYFPKVDELDPFFPLIAFYRARMLLSHLIQNGEISMVTENREMYIKESVRLFKVAYQTFPENKLIRAYLGDYEPWTEEIETNSKAPVWANYQRTVLEKLAGLVHWWVDNRQISDGQFGGGWGDDVEMWRSWIPVLFAFEDKMAVKSQEKLFEGLYALSKMKQGFTTSMNDVEHTSEEYADPLTCMLNLQPENPVWEKRALKVLDLIENLWTGVNERGQLQFKSTWFNVNKVDLNEKRACDSPYHTRVVQPQMLLWLRTGNERIERFVTSWLTTWVNATFTEECGKPMGIVPAAIHWPDGKPVGTGKNWWQPENYHTPLYDYPSQQEMMYECFLQAYHITKDDFFLKPIQFVAKKRLKGMGDEDMGKYQPGSLEWCLSALKKSLPGILIKYRLITGDISFDSILRKDADGYDRFVLDNNIENLTQSLNRLKDSLSLPREFFTTEVRWTDRLFAFTGKYFNYILKDPVPLFNAGFLFSSLTGSIGNFKILPVFGVKWLTSPNEIAILTKTNEKQKFEAQLFHFGENYRKMGGCFYNLDNGKYRITLNGKKILEANISESNRTIEFTLPPQELSKLKIEK